MKTDIEMKAMAYDAFIKAQKKKDPRSCGLGFEAGVKAASITLEGTFNALKWAESIKAKKELPRVKCRNGVLIAKLDPDKPLSFSHLKFSEGERLIVRIFDGDVGTDFSLPHYEVNQPILWSGGGGQVDEMTYNSPYIKTS